MIKDLVSIITPCYNTAKYIPRLLESILSQDYPFIEMIIVDDGSTDNTLDIVENYEKKFSEKGYKYTILKQKNAGQSVAINNGLKLVNGEFLAWPDSDDWYNSPFTISKLVEDLKSLPEEYGETRCLPTFVSETDINNRRNLNILPIHLEEEQFEYCLDANNFIFEPGNYLLRTKVLDETIPGREIYTEKMAGQNWQIHLPILYKYKCHTIKEFLYCVLERANSHSRGQFKDPKQIYEKFHSYYNTLIATLDKINMPNECKHKYKYYIHDKHLNFLFIMACESSLYLEAVRCVKGMNKEQITKPKYTKLKLLFAKYPIINNISRKLYSKLLRLTRFNK